MSFRDYLEEHFTVVEASGGAELRFRSGECPFCGKSGDISLYVNVRTWAGYCQHCATGFGPLQFVMAREGCDRKTARRTLRGFKGGYVRSTGEVGEERIEIPWPVLESVFDHPEGRAYLNGRNVADSMIDHFDLFYCPVDMSFGGKVYRTKDRIIIPIKTAEGEFAGWQGRDATGRSRVKYLFPPGFDAGDHLFNVQNVESKEFVILVEGTFDVFGWARFGIRNVLATFGKKISANQLDTLMLLRPAKLLLAWDTDANWEKQVFCENYGHLFDIRIVDLGGKDADEVTKGEILLALKSARAYSWRDKILARLSSI